MLFSHSRPLVALIGAALLSATQMFAPSIAAADTASGTVSGTVIDQRNALPISGANVVLSQGDAIVASATTNPLGRFTVKNVPPGSYFVTVAARGYSSSETPNVVVFAGSTVTVNAVLVQAANASEYRTLGTVAVTANVLASATTIQQNVSVQNVAQTGQIRFANQLASLPAINLQTSSSPGDDVSINMRGFGSSETAALLDGRPVGPLGVLAPNTYNFADSTIAALTGVDVTYGSGAQGLYGSDTIAGAVNMHLLSPTKTPQDEFTQQVGGNGLLTSILSFTGTEGRFGYVGEAGVSGTSGVLNGDIFQSARPSLLAPGSATPNFLCGNSSGIDVSACNQAADTYLVGQQSKLTTELGKFTYALAPATSISLSAYSTVQWANSTGNGDNDFLPYTTRLAQLQAGGPNCVIGGGTTNNGYTVITNPVTNTQACWTAQHFAAASYGPDGGGAGRNRSASMRDYDLHFTTKEGVHNIALDSYINDYYYEKDSSLSGGLGVGGVKLGVPDFTNYFDTTGYLLSDDIQTADNNLGFGFALLNQPQSGQALVSVGSYPSGEPIFAFQPNFTPVTYRTNSFFVRDDRQFNDRFSAFANAWVKNSNVTSKTTFDPRFSAQYRPDAQDVLRLTFGHSDGPPAPELKSTGVVFEPDPGSSLTHVSCLINSLPASGGNPNLISESANDVEFGIGHRFGDDSNIQANAYVTSVRNQLFSAAEPLLQYGLGNVSFASTTLQTYLTKLIAQGCLPPGSGPTATYPFLGVNTTYNAADELARGIDVNGRYRFARMAYLDYGWSVESSRQLDIPTSILVHNLTLVNGIQQNGIPLHQGNVSLDVQPRGYEFRLDSYYIGNNNPLDRPAYWYSNAFLSHPINNGKEILTLGGTNVFNQAAQTYGYIGNGTPQQVNQFARGYLTGLGQNIAGIFSNEEFGIQPAQITFTLTIRR